MALKPTLAKGTRDFGPLQVVKRNFIMDTMKSVFKSYGFLPLETPAMENLSTLEGKYGSEGDQLLFRIINSGDYLNQLKEYNSTLLADESKDSTFAPSVSGLLNDLDAKAALPYITEKGLRYDLTVPFARYITMNRHTITWPFKRYQIQPVWRADRPQKGRYREFWQCDADVAGSESLVCESDLIHIYHDAFTRLGMPEYTIKLSNRKVLAGIAQVVHSEAALATISIAIDKLDKAGPEVVQNELLQKGFTHEQCRTLFDIINISGTNTEKLNQLESVISLSTVGLKGISELRNVLSWCEDVHISVDFSLARGLTYYTGCIVEVVYNKGSLKSSIGGGGRYDNLTGIFGMPGISGVGISFGLDRIYDIMDELNLFPENLQATSTRVLVCAMSESALHAGMNAVKKLRAAHIASELYPDVKKVGKQLDYANALKIPYAIIIGENEMSTGEFMFKNLNEGTQQSLSIENIISQLKT
ncbi:MAG: histidine--tRNA ligase [Bacteroidota bacterium]|jgi:histidyl-tRNA synthetase